MPQHEFITKQLIDKGWSEDKKYCVTDERGNKFLLRISPIEQYGEIKTDKELSVNYDLAKEETLYDG